MRVPKKLLVGLMVGLAIGAVGFTFWLRDRYVVPILMYHYVGKPVSPKWCLNTVSVKSFDYQMNFLKRHGYNVISFDDFVHGLKQGQMFSRNTVVIQFDDGYEDNYTNAFPILEHYGFPAMVFLISDRVGTQGFLTWDQIKGMEAGGVMAGAHTRHHAYLPALPADQAEDEIVGSKRIIEQHLGHRIDYFCYPLGGFTPAEERMVRQAGFEAAVTTNRGKHKFDEDIFALQRIHMKDGDDRFNGLILWAKLSGYYNLFRSPKNEGRSQRKSYED